MWGRRTFQGVEVRHGTYSLFLQQLYMQQKGTWSSQSGVTWVLIPASPLLGCMGEDFLPSLSELPFSPSVYKMRIIIASLPLWLWGLISPVPNPLQGVIINTHSSLLPSPTTPYWKEEEIKQFSTHGVEERNHFPSRFLLVLLCPLLASILRQDHMSGCHLLRWRNKVPVIPNVCYRSEPHYWAVDSRPLPRLPGPQSPAFF